MDVRDVRAQEGVITWSTLVQHSPPPPKTLSWGFPKGQKKTGERSKETAMREFEEETGLTREDYILLKSYRPVYEHLLGLNEEHYHYTYFLAAVHNPTLPLAITSTNCHEVSDIRWVTVLQALELISPKNVSKRVLLQEIDAALSKGICLDDTSATSITSISTSLPSGGSGNSTTSIGSTSGGSTEFNSGTPTASNGSISEGRAST